jgi:hypothetical protein
LTQAQAEEKSESSRNHAHAHDPASPEEENADEDIEYSRNPRHSRPRTLMHHVSCLPDVLSPLSFILFSIAC